MMNARGNIFLAMFAAVGLAGVIGFGTTQFVRGPVSASSDLTRKNVAHTELMIASQLAITAAGLQTSGGDCDSDGFVEPLRYRDAGVADKPVGGGYIPLALGTNKTDPWGIEYGYCVWDHGAETLQASCQASGNDYRLAGGNVKTQPVLILVSAGPDRTFQTTCRPWADVNADGIPDQDLFEKAGGSDDIITHYTYTEAADLSGDLWSIKAGDPDVATIAKDLEVTGGAEFAGTVSFNSGGLVLPDETGSGACNAANADVLRRNTTTSPPTLEICINDGSPAWEAVSGGGGGAPTVVQSTTPAVSDYTTGDVKTMSFSTLPTAGNAVLVMIGFYDSSNLILPSNAVTDNQGNTYTKVIQTDISWSGGPYTAIYAAYNIGAPSGTFTVTINIPASTHYETYMMSEVSGLATSSTSDQTGSSTETGGPTTSLTVSTSGSTTQDSELVVAGIYKNSTVTNFNISSGWTSFGQNDTKGFSFAYKTVSSMGVQSHTWTYDDNGANYSGASVATFKASGSGGGGSGTPGGSDTQVQYNDGGSFNGDTMLVWDETNNQLGVGSTTTHANIDLGTDAGSAGGGGIVVEQKTALRIHDFYDDWGYTSSESFSTLPTAGNSILVAVRTISNAAADVANGDVTDNQGNTYTRIAVSGDAAYGQRVYLFLASNIGTPSGTFTITVNVDTAGIGREAWGAMEISGLANSSVVDQTVSEHSSCLASETLTTGTTTQADELAIGFNFLSSNTITDFTVSGGWTEEYRNLPQEFSLISQILSATGAPSNTWTITSSGRYWCPRLMVTLKGSGGGGGGGSTGQKLLSYSDGSNGRSGLGANMDLTSSYQTNLFGQNDGTNGNLSFGFVATSDGTTYTEKMRLTQAGRLGIGVTAPDAPLEVSGEVILGDTSLACDASREGGIKYDTSSNTVKYCDGAGTWAAISSGGGGGGGGGGSVAGSSGEIQYNDEGVPGAEPNFIWDKTNNRVGIGRATPVAAIDINGSVIVGMDSTTCDATIKGTIRFNTTSSRLQFCNSTSWVSLMSGSATGTTSIPSSNTGYFVLTKTRWSSDLDQMPGANAKCLTELGTTYDWNGKTTANTNGWLNANHIEAFICSQYVCQNPMPNTTYAFATAGYTGVGGATFTADENSRGPNNSQNWAGTNYFGTATTWWSGRDSLSSTQWSESYVSAYTGNGDWDTGGYNAYGKFGVTNTTDSDRWAAGDSPGDKTLSLICMVHP